MNGHGTRPDRQPVPDSAELTGWCEPGYRGRDLPQVNRGAGGFVIAGMDAV
jgi:hypothetical protein